jgi:hypothetical protein
MSDFLSSLNGKDAFPIVIVAIVFGSVALVLLGTIVAVCFYKIRKLTTSTQLKQDMLDRGMSAEEIKLVLEARPNA